MVGAPSDPIWWELQARGLERPAGRRFGVRLGGNTYQVSISAPEGLHYQVMVDGKPIQTQLALLGQDVGPSSPTEKRSFRINVDGRWLRVELAEGRGGQPSVWVETAPVKATMAPAGPVQVRRLKPKPIASKQNQGAPAGPKDKKVVSAMPGRIVAVSVKEGQQVTEGQELCVLEAMKMEQMIRAPMAGVVKKVPIKAGQAVFAGDLLAELE